MQVMCVKSGGGCTAGNSDWRKNRGASKLTGSMGDGGMGAEGLPQLFFFFQAEDGIRDLTVTGVQTCALPISARPRAGPDERPRARRRRRRAARGEVVPLVRVELFERRLTPELESRLIERLTETLLEVLEAPELKEHTWVIVEGHDAHRWGRNAKPWDEGGT